jgi:UMF1 family MFS transporter
MYDFANSAYSTVLITIFNTYFLVVVKAAGKGWDGEALWGYATSFSILLVALSAPALGAMADLAGSKKRFLIVFCYVGAFSSMLMATILPGQVLWLVSLYVFVEYCFAASFTFYNAFLPDLADHQTMGRVSSYGFAFGYVGGALCLIVDIGLLFFPQVLGLPARGDTPMGDYMVQVNYLPMRAGLFVMGAWWAVFSIPTVLWLQERPQPAARLSVLGYVRAGYTRMFGTLRAIRKFPELARFFVAYLIYNDGIETVIYMASPFAVETLKMSPLELTLCILMIQLVATPGALAFGWLADRVGQKQAVASSLAFWIVLVLSGYVVSQRWQFWMLAVGVALVLGGSQAVSRSIMGLMVPARHTAEFFGFFALSGKAASVFGPLTYAITKDVTGSSRGALVSLALFFLVGGVILVFVNVSKGRSEAERSDTQSPGMGETPALS